MQKLVVLTLALSLAVVAGPGSSADVGIEILVSPQNILLGADQGGMVTVHADIAYGLVATGTLTLSGVPVRFAFADSRGDLVAKFLESDVKDLFEGCDSPTTAVLTLAGLTKAGEPLSGSDVVKVRPWAAAR